MKPDLDTRARIAEFVDAFYARVLVDPVLKPLFVDVGQIDLEKHLPLIRAYWEKLLLGENDYHRHTMNIHRALDAKRHLEAEAFVRWLELFQQTVNERHQGPKAERAKQVARHIAFNMNHALGNAPLDVDALAI